MTDADGYNGPFRADTLSGIGTSAVFVGSFLPAHDTVFDLAAHIGVNLGSMHAYIRRVRDVDQADSAIKELLDAFRDPQKFIDTYSKPQPYHLHYTSADGPGEDATWSVYVEDYARKGDAEPIDGSQRLVQSGLPNEKAADTLADLLQRCESPLTEDSGRQVAIDWQHWMSEQSLSYGELAEWASKFEQIAQAFPDLADEFRENGII